MTSAETDLPSGLSPYRGLAAFGDSDLDARLFFGRERESEIVAANLQASRLTVLYGASGVGKSSLLRAGVVHRLRANGDTGAARQVVAVCASWRGDPIASVTTAVAEAIAATLGEEGTTTARGSLADELDGWCARLDGEIYIVLDQLEEYVLYHGADRGGPLAHALAEIVTRPSLRVGILIGIRDDALSELDTLKAKVPGLFANLLRLDHLTREEGREAIVGPLEELVMLGADRVTAEDALVTSVLDQVAAGRIVLGEGAGVLPEEAGDGRIEAPFLQLVMERLWDVERERGSTTLREETLAELGGAARIVEEHLDSALAALDDDGRTVAAAVLGFLVTPSGTKIAHRADDLVRYAGVDTALVGPVLDALVDARVLRRVAEATGDAPRYEIFHDVLAPAVLDAVGQFESDRMIATERRRRRRAVTVAAVALAAVGLMAAVTVYALDQRAEADQQASLAKHSAEEAQDALDRANISETKLDQMELRLGDLRDATAVERAHVAELRRTARLLGAASARDAAEALAQTSTAEANEKVAKSSEYITVDPELSLLLAVSAADVIRSGVVENALRSAIRLSNVRGVLGTDGPVTSVDYGGGLLLVASEDGVARLYRASDRTLLGRLEHGSPITDAQLDRDGRRAVSGAADGSVAVWQVRGARLLRRFRHGGRVTALAFQRGGDIVLSASLDHTVRLTRPSGEHVTYRHPAPVTGAEWSANGSRIVVWGGKQVALLDSRGTLLETFTHEVGEGRDAHDVDVASAAINADGSLVATGSERVDGTIHLVATSPGVPDPVVLTGHVGEVFDLDFSPDSALLASGAADGGARVWNVDTGELVAAVAGHHNYVTRVAFSPDGKWLVTGSRDGTARVRPANATEDGSLLAGHRDRVNDVVFSPSGLQVATAGEDGDARVWDAGTAPQLVSIRRGSARSVLHPPRTVAHSPHGRLIARAEGDVVTLFDTRTGKLRKRLVGHHDDVSSVVFSDNGTQVLTASRDHEARVWSVATGLTVHLLNAHFGAVADARWSPDGRWIVTAGPTTAGLWIAESGAFVEYVRGPKPPAVLRTAAFGPDSRSIYTLERDGTTRRWFCDICGTVAELQRLGQQRLASTGRVWTLTERRLAGG